MANEMYTVVSGIPVPPRGGHGRTPVYPLRDMKPGDSFMFHGGQRAAKRVAAAIQNMKSRKNHEVYKDWSFTIRYQGNEEYRCWRTK